MDKQKKGRLTTSSIVDLKAELLKKQQQCKHTKTLGTAPGTARPSAKKTDLWSRSNAGVQKRAEKDFIDQGDEDDMIKSRKALEAKAKLYEAMTSGNSVQDEDGSKTFLVDFERKSIDRLTNQTCGGAEINGQVDMKDEVPITAHDTCVYNPSLEDGTSKIGERGINFSKVAEPELMSQDMYREKLRLQWEKEVEDINEKSDSLHYANVQFNEIRDHGVGYFQFNKDDAARKEQLEQLQQIRAQTKDARANSDSLKAKRKAVMAARLAKVRQRKAIREGKDPASVADLDSSDDDDVIGPRPPEQNPEAEPLTRDDSWRRDAPIREWDKDKEGLDDLIKGHRVLDETSWLEKLRSERNEEFAPPIYQQNSHHNQYKARKLKKPYEETKDHMHAVNRADIETNLRPFSSDHIGTTLKSIRTDMEGSHPAFSKHEQSTTVSAMKYSSGGDASVATSTGGTKLGFDLSDIPLPPTTTSLPMDNSPNVYPDQNMQNMNQSDPPNSHFFMPPPPLPLETAHSIIPPTQPQNDNWEQPTVTYSDGHVYTADCNAWVTTTPVTSDTSPAIISAGPQLIQAQQPAPQPAHYSSAPCTTSLSKKPRYERVHLHELPPSLPAPPTSSNIPEYPSQEEVIGPRRKKSDQDGSRKGIMTEQQAIKQWQQQFQYQGAGRHHSAKPAALKPDNIPFASPYIQSTEQGKAADPASKFDPSKPPPTLSK